MLAHPLPELAQGIIWIAERVLWIGRRLGEIVGIAMRTGAERPGCVRSSNREFLIDLLPRQLSEATGFALHIGGLR